MKLPRRIQIKHPIKLLVLFLAAAALTGCSRKEPKKEYVARVNDSYLTTEELNEKPGAGSGSKFFKSEYVNNWIRREVLYQEAQREGLLDDQEYKRIVEDTKKELAAAMIINRFFDDESVVYEPKDVEEFYRKNGSSFRLSEEGYLYNVISFSNEDRAVRFRQAVIESDWNKALNAFNNDSSLLTIKNSVLSYQYEIHPSLLLKMLKELYPLEVSIVLEDSPGTFLVTQLVERFGKGTIPPFETIKQQVEKSFIAERKEKLLESYIKELYSDNEIEVKGTK